MVIFVDFFSRFAEEKARKFEGEPGPDKGRRNP